MAAHLIRDAKHLFREVFAVAKEVEWIPRDVQGEVPFYLDRWAEKTPVAGLATALPLARFEPVFLLSCHQPILHESVIRGLWEQWSALEKPEIISPWIHGRWRPFRSLWPKEVQKLLVPGKLQSLEELLETPGVAVHKVTLPCFKSWDPSLASLRELENLQDWMEIGGTQI
jgi:molybdopterin-guanine dinucleotide biosynthesis protein A